MDKSKERSPQPSWRRHRSLNFSIGLVLSLTMVITAFEWNFKSPLTHKRIDSLSVIDVTPPEMVVVSMPPPPKPATPPNPDEIIETKVEPVKPKDPLKNLPPIEGTEGALENDFTNPFGTDLPATLPAEVTDKPQYELIPAAPIGGEKAFYNYLYQNIHYPAHLVERSRSGKVMVKFDVDEKGRLTNIQIIEGFDKSLEKEIIRVLKASPAWKPAQLGATKVRTSHKIPFSFDLK